MDEKLTELWISRKKRGSEYRQLFEDKWIENWMAFRNTNETPRLSGMFWTQNKVLPDAFKVVQTLVPQHVLGMFRDPRWLSVQAPTVAGQSMQDAVRSMLLQGWRKADMFRKSVTALTYAAVMGHTVSKIWWETKLRDYSGEEMGYLHNGPQVSMPDLFNVWQDPTGLERWFIERIAGNIEEMKTQNKQFGGALYKNLGKIEVSKSLEPHISTDNSTPSEIVDGISRTLTSDPDDVELWQCWGHVPESVKKYDDTQWRLQVIAQNEILIRDVPAPTPDHRPAYVNTQSVHIPHQVYGESILTWVNPLIERRSAIENYRHDEILLNMYQQWIIDEEAEYGPNNLLRQPGGVAYLSVPRDKKLSEIMWPVPRSPVLPDAWNESAVKEDQINRTSGSTDHFQGQGLGSRASATEAGLVAQASGGRHALQTMWLDETFKKPLLERMFRLYQSRLQEPLTVDVGGERTQISVEDLQYDVDIYVDSGKFGSMDQQQVSNLVQALGVLGNNPVSAPYLNYGKIAKDIFYRFGFSEADNYVRNDREVAELRAAEQEQQLRARAAEGIVSGEGRVPQNGKQSQ